MSMSVGELFVSLGIKGNEKTLGAITGVKKALSETASTSLETKAALVGAMYALERLIAHSGAAGTNLTNFNAALGVSAQTLQKYQFAARQMGVANQEVEGSFKSLQSTITKTLMGEGAPKGMARLAQLTGEIKPGDLLRFQQNPELLIQKLQQYAQREKNVGLRNETLKSFGMGDGMIAALSRGAFSASALAKAPTYSDKEIGALDRANIAWSNLGNKIEMAIGHFNARHGSQLVKDFTLMTDSVIKLAEALEQVATKFKVIETIGHGLEGIANTLKLLSEISDKLSGKESKKGDILYTKPGESAFPGMADSPVGKFFSSLFGGGASPAPALAGGAAHIPLPAYPTSGKQQNITVKQDLHFQHDGKDHAKTGESVKKAVQESYRQMSAQGQGS